MRACRPSPDWPLSREEKKQRLIELFSQDINAANELLQERLCEQPELEGNTFDVHASQQMASSHIAATRRPSLQPTARTCFSEHSRTNVRRSRKSCPVLNVPTACRAPQNVSCDAIPGNAASTLPLGIAAVLDTNRGSVSRHHHSTSPRSSEYATPESSPRSPQPTMNAQLAAPGTGQCSFSNEQAYLPNHHLCQPSSRQRRRSESDTRPSIALQQPCDASSLQTQHFRAASARKSRPSHPKSSADPVLLAMADPNIVVSAARHGRHREVEAALVAGFAPSNVDQFGNTLFHIACQNGNKRIAKLAIKHGGHMDAQNERGNTGLHFLFAYGYADVAEYFISKGADERTKNAAGLEARRGIR